MSFRFSLASRLSALTIFTMAALLIWALKRQPATPPSVSTVPSPAPTSAQSDTQLVHQLLSENLDTRRFSFPVIVDAVSGKKVIPLDPECPSHQRVTRAIETALREACAELSQIDSPIRQLRRINEGSRFFEEALRQKLDANEGLRCEIPTTRDGKRQRSGYPDLMLTDISSGEIFYLDPKLVENRSWKSSFRSFYFEPKTKTLKINHDATHLLLGIGHDGKTRAWTFEEWKIVDLSTLSVRLKAEFQASNRDIYRSPVANE